MAIIGQLPGTEGGDATTGARPFDEALDESDDSGEVIAATIVRLSSELSLGEFPRDG
jgi:hypothetical protein